MGGSDRPPRWSWLSARFRPSSPGGGSQSQADDGTADYPRPHRRGNGWVHGPGEYGGFQFGFSGHVDVVGSGAQKFLYLPEFNTAQPIETGRLLGWTRVVGKQDNLNNLASACNAAATLVNAGHFA